jgi:hypothetical protein
MTRVNIIFADAFPVEFPRRPPRALLCSRTGSGPAGGLLRALSQNGHRCRPQKRRSSTKYHTHAISCPVARLGLARACSTQDACVPSAGLLETPYFSPLFRPLITVLPPHGPLQPQEHGFPSGDHPADHPFLRVKIASCGLLGGACSGFLCQSQRPDDRLSASLDTGWSVGSLLPLL